MFGQISQIRMLEYCISHSSAKKYDHVTPLLKSLSQLPVKDQLYYHQAIMAFKCMTGQAPEYILHSNLLPVSKLANEQLGVAGCPVAWLLKKIGT